MADRKTLLESAREDWAHDRPEPWRDLCADNLIAMAVGCKRQQWWPGDPLTPEDAAILRARCPHATIDDEGRYRGFGNDTATLSYLCNLNT